MTLLEMIHSLTPNVCKANDCDENDIAQILMLAYKFNKDEIDHHAELASRVLLSIEKLKDIVTTKPAKVQRYDEWDNPVDNTKEIEMPDFLKYRGR